MTTVRVTVHDAQIRALNLPSGALGRFRLRVANRVLNNARTRVNVDTGNLRSTGVVEDRGTTVRVAFRAKYALAVHNGSRPHVISARPGGVLRFPVMGGMAFARTVNHPGYRGNPYLTDALTEEMNRL